jgi:hypothetical protein
MIDQLQRITELVEKELTTQALGQDDLGFVVSQALTLMPTPDGQVTPTPVWMVTVSTRHPLGPPFGTEPDIAIAMVIPGALPTDDNFKRGAKQSLDNVLQVRDQINAEIMQEGARIDG